MRWRFLLSLMIVASVLPVRGAIRPSFMLDYSAWHSTDIVLVTATEVDGQFSVVEAWKGNLHSGARISIPELRPDPKALPLSRYPHRSFCHDLVKEVVPRQLLGAQLVLFLKKDAASSTEGDALHQHWSASSFEGDMKASAVWIDGARLFSFIQVMNPGPSCIEPWDMSLDKLKNEVAEVIKVQRELTSVADVKDGSARAVALKPYLRSKLLPARRAALEELRKCGPAAVPAIDAMLDDPDYVAESGELVKAMVEDGGKSVADDLVTRLRKDLDFWRGVAPSLHVGWWNHAPTMQSSLRNKYGETIEIIRGLDTLRVPDALPDAIELRNFWNSLPQLEDLTQLTADCDKLIDDLKQQSGKVGEQK